MNWRLCAIISLAVNAFVALGLAVVVVLFFGNRIPRSLRVYSGADVHYGLTKAQVYEKLGAPDGYACFQEWNTDQGKTSYREVVDYGRIRSQSKPAYQLELTFLDDQLISWKD